MRNEEGNESMSHSQSGRFAKSVCQDCIASTQTSSGNEGAQTTHTLLNKKLIKFNK